MYSQDFPIPAEGAEWNLAERQGTSYSAERIVCIGDTTIESKDYSKLFQTWSANYYQTGTCKFEYTSGPHQRNSYRGAIRTEENQKVYYIFPGEDTIRLIYDFDVSTGDSIKIDGMTGNYYAYVTDIDTIIIGAHQRKQIALQGIYGEYDQWIEGIGSVYGLFATFMRPWEKYATELTCYQEFGERLYPSISNCDRCNIVTEEKVESSDTRISIYPNPTTGIFFARWPERMEIQKLIIYNPSGKIIFMKNAISTNNLAINSKELEKGVLILEVIDDDRSSYKHRIVVL